MTASAWAATAGLAVDTINAHGALQSASLSEDDLARGLWDGAAIEVWRVDWSSVSDRILMFAGSIGEVERASLAFMAELRSLAHALGQPSVTFGKWALRLKQACFQRSKPVHLKFGADCSLWPTPTGSLYCNRAELELGPNCLKFRNDLDWLGDRLGRDHSYLAADLAGKFICSECKSRAISGIISPPTKLVPGSVGR